LNATDYHQTVRGPAWLAPLVLKTSRDAGDSVGSSSFETLVQDPAPMSAEA
jgi:hypothetical protein